MFDPQAPAVIGKVFGGRHPISQLLAVVPQLTSSVHTLQISELIKSDVNAIAPYIPALKDGALRR